MSQVRPSFVLPIYSNHNHCYYCIPYYCTDLVQYEFTMSFPHMPTACGDERIMKERL